MGRRKIAEYLKEKYGVAITEQRVRQYSSTFFYDTTEKAVFYQSAEVGVDHHRCVTKEDLVPLLVQKHQRDHRGVDTCYESLRSPVYPSFALVCSCYSSRALWTRTGLWSHIGYWTHTGSNIYHQP